ncbi:hypothetical protein NLG97_g807 [Lecanicillium saksenae]|uniref:Uncharacterized protein n=1 Tax=Lecanicillium saksenae TaxID=468837 RepID=A0ACC1R5Q0_9HYPO|nr:hypothetical protein NLG97_g807 [Lecanicillium saksenae]
MKIQVGDTFPDAHIHLPDTQATGSEPIPTATTTHEKFKGKTVVLVGDTGAYIPSSEERIRGFLQHHDALTAKGVDMIAFMTSDDVFVMHAWGLHLGVGDKIQLLTDGNMDLGVQLGLERNLRGPGMGTRMVRIVMILKDLKVMHLSTDSDDGATSVDAEAALANL